MVVGVVEKERTTGKQWEIQGKETTLQGYTDGYISYLCCVDMGKVHGF